MLEMQQTSSGGHNRAVADHMLALQGGELEGLIHYALNEPEGGSHKRSALRYMRPDPSDKDHL